MAVRKKTGLAMGLSRGCVSARERPLREKVKERLRRYFVGAFAFLIRHGLSHGLAAGALPVACVLYSDGYNPGCAFRATSSRVRVSLGAFNISTGVAVESITVLDMRKRAYKDWLLEDQSRELKLLGLCEVHTVTAGVAKALVTHHTGDHFDRWCSTKGLGPMKHRCASCPVPMKEWSLHTWRFPHLTLQQMAAEGFTHHMAEECPTSRYASPYLHDLKGMMKLVLKYIDGDSRRAVDLVQRRLDMDVGGNVTATQLRQFVQELSTPEPRALCSTVWKWVVLTLSELSHFRFSNGPWSYWALKETDALMPFLRARVAAHIFIMCLGRAAPLALRSTYVHSLCHWFSVHDAVPNPSNDDAGERGNGIAKRRSAMTSVPTYEEILGMCEEKTYRAVTPLPRTTRTQDGFAGSKVLVMCDCIRGTAETQARGALALSALCRELEVLCKGFVHRAPAHTAFMFSQGTGTLRLCLCGRNPRKLTWQPFDPRGPLPERAAQKEWEVHGEPWADASESSSTSSDDDDSTDENTDSSTDSSDTDDNNEFPCPLPSCHRMFHTKAGLAAHLDSRHRPALPPCGCRTECPVCGDRVSTKGFSQHVVYKHADRFASGNTCLLCFDSFRSVRQLQNHYKSAH
eukprot:TRINITY_DN9933_c0_g1_i1.p1 TRINITY_DN9933_c0_g1~~TRINITY_DN9933_c0_g1_i1.p1  ORF type:complete len:684 (+),score=2.85 TRINITY_DN9933_c0_g1_i1:164-2053(+)